MGVCFACVGMCLPACVCARACECVCVVCTVPLTHQHSLLAGRSGHRDSRAPARKQGMGQITQPGTDSNSSLSTHVPS